MVALAIAEDGGAVEIQRWPADGPAFKAGAVHTGAYLLEDQVAFELASSALGNGIFDILQDLKFYLTGDPGDIATVRAAGPTRDSPTNRVAPAKCAFQIRFDGINWTTFSMKNTAVVG
ncbi:MAG TPA: hypothetical protein VFJ10_06740 [Acidobacteriaceae bacterium]|nr:hypothetical protein [Acidobacteriaceae bacterium]